MNISIGQLKYAIEKLPNFESFPANLFKVAVLHPEVVRIDSSSDTDTVIEIIEIVFKKNHQIGDWEISGTGNSAPLKLEPLESSNGYGQYGEDFERMIIFQILQKLLLRNPEEREILSVERKIIQKAGDREFEVLFMGSRLGVLQYTMRTVVFIPDRNYGYSVDVEL